MSFNFGEILYKNIEARLNKIFVPMCEDKHKAKVPWRVWARSLTINVSWNSEKSKFVFDRKGQLCGGNCT
jgi:hypothetical protein